MSRKTGAKTVVEAIGDGKNPNAAIKQIVLAHWLAPMCAAIFARTPDAKSILVRASGGSSDEGGRSMYVAFFPEKPKVEKAAKPDTEEDEDEDEEDEDEGLSVYEALTGKTEYGMDDSCAKQAFGELFAWGWEYEEDSLRVTKTEDGKFEFEELGGNY